MEQVVSSEERQEKKRRKTAQDIARDGFEGTPHGNENEIADGVGGVAGSQTKRCGYRQGGISPIATGAESWGPEKIDSYEVVAKASFRGSVSGFFNIAAFYNDLSG